MSAEGREAELAAALAAVRARVVAATRAAGRDDEVELVVVTKFFPASDVRLLAGLGVGAVGENRHQEAAAKAAETADLGLRWHFIGGLQSNKAAAVAAYADVVESLDRPKLLAPLARGRAERDVAGPLDCLVQVSLDPPGAEHRAGCPPEQVAELCDAVAGTDGLRLAGLMAVAPLGEDPAAAFARLADQAARVRAEHPGATVLSAGMSGDLEEAVAAGATHVRVGSAVLGARPRVQ
ncbi:YggS family pyridoxal phosphate-dependent enzyme [Nocardioides sp. ChNu-153]|uniref:YggS family pyridoxal phosphate-dependent enzyme n=1 Tax=unclassified Nocardioides TaxID=2615069 RepID=UPI002404BDD2|nr:MULTISPECIES: YggS family pyridoxal phosphate-dependent enzyme [unclassified Nocardioides]MDF9716562.1 YggS family pyridoxal phosphate-dependent enzyme [Nocardioides sp. ChNu-99]MDN7120903.1 YggS family pyridoxal phosphate-dependent enzyme [Nocardioides sp. ChNu-153]